MLRQNSWRRTEANDSNGHLQPLSHICRTCLLLGTVSATHTGKMRNQLAQLAFSINPIHS